MADQSIEMTGQEYERRYFPFGGFILVKKDMEPEKIGAIHLTDKIRDEHSKFACTGVVIAKSPMKHFEEKYDEYVHALVKKGDRIGFSGTVPLYAPSPPRYQFQGDEKEQYVTIHVRDILGIICETDKERVEFMEREF